MPLSAVITAAAPKQRHLLHQTLAKADSQLETLAQFAVDLVAPEGQEAVVDRVALIIPEGDRERYRDLEERHERSLTLIEQTGQPGYAQALYQARDFVGEQAFLHIVGDHFYLANEGHASGLARELVETYRDEGATVSAVQPTREALLPYFGAVGGTPQTRASGRTVYRIETILEKPTPTEAEQRLFVPGLRGGHYLCFFGMHVFSPGVMPLIEQGLREARGPESLSGVLEKLVQREPYFAVILPGTRFDLGARYGILQAQLALALRGPDREEVLAMMLELLAR
jgi:UTP--glucose-1-phosphate uridylyltransferase